MVRQQANGAPVELAYTGADVVGLSLAGLALVAGGLGTVLVSRRRRDTA